jgi:hypothetical protein
VAKRAADTIATPRSQPETATVNGRTSEPADVDFEESSGGPVIEQVPANGETEIAPAPPAFPSPTYIETTFARAVESVIEPSIEPAIEQAEPEPVAAAAEKSVPERTSARVRHVEPVEAQASVLETEVCEPTVAEAVALSEIEEQISTRESSPQPEPIEQGQPVPYQIVVSAEQSAEIAAPEKPEIAAVAEIAGVGRAIAGLGALPEALKSQRPVTKNILLHNQQQSKPCLKHSRPQQLLSFKLVACTRLFKSPSLAKSLRCN